MTSVPVLTDYQPNYERSNLEMLQTSPSLLPPHPSLFLRSPIIINNSLPFYSPSSPRSFISTIFRRTYHYSLPLASPFLLQFFQFLLLVFSFSIISIALFSFASIASAVTTRRVVNFVHVHDRDTIRNDATIFQKRFQTIRLVLVI